MAPIAPWITDVYENDIFCAWLAKFAIPDNPNILFDAIERVTEASNDELNTRNILECLAACCMLPRLKIYWGVQDNENDAIVHFGDYSMRLPTPDLVMEGLSAIDRILRLPSGLEEESDYSENELFQWWLDYVDNLQLRITRIINDNPDYDWESIPGYPRE